MAPPSAVLRAFGATGEPILLSGGFGDAWRAGDLVLKRSDAGPAALECEARVLASVTDVGVRLQRLRRAVNGSLTVDTWIAHDYLEGSQASDRWNEVLEVGDALHAAMRGIGREDAAPLVDGRTDPWGVADRIAWEEEPLPQGAARVDAALRRDTPSAS